MSDLLPGEPSRTPVQLGTFFVVAVLLVCRHERTLKRRLAGKPYNFSGLLQGANEWGERANRPQTVSIIAVPTAQGGNGGRAKAKGRFLLRDLALSAPIFRDLVRVPDHSAYYPRIARHPRATARAFTSPFGDNTCRKSFPSAVLFQLPGPSLVADSRRRLLVRSLLLEDHSSAETNSTLDQ
jgi:hypothetical protein